VISFKLRQKKQERIRRKNIRDCLIINKNTFEGKLNNSRFHHAEGR
jgi:hypothetical protein